MNTGELHDCSTNDLRQAIESDRAKIKPVGKESILEDVWKIGNQLERVKRGEIGRNLFFSSERHDHTDYDQMEQPR